MLPFFFRHYDRFVDRYFIHDNQSTDGSLSILKAHPRVTILPLVLEGESLMDAAFAQLNQFWHPSRGEADWVAVCNIDEFFWHFDMPWYLRQCRRKGITFLRSQGYHMVSETFPAPGDDLVRVHRFGVREACFFDKPAFFNPDAITESGFGIGRHTADPKGHVVRPVRDEIVLAHYKYLSLDYVMQRHAELNARRRPGDVKKGHGRHYDAEASRADFASFLERRIQVLPKDQSVLARYRRRLLRHRIRVREATES